MFRSDKSRPPQPPEPNLEKPHGSRHGSLKGFLAGVVVAALIGTGGFLRVNQLWDQERQNLLMEWGPPYTSLIVAGSVVEQPDYAVAVREVQVQYAPDSPWVTVRMAEPDIALSTTHVWHNRWTGEVYVDGDISNRYRGKSPTQVEDHVDLLGGTFFLMLAAFVMLWAIGTNRQARYKRGQKRLSRLRQQFLRTSSRPSRATLRRFRGKRSQT